MIDLEKIYKESNEVQQAYFDCYLESEKNVDDYRNLDWKSNSFYSVEEAFNLFDSAVEEYNEFYPGILFEIEKLFENPKVCPAREGSVCIYVKGVPKVTLDNICKNLNADEVDEIDGEIRIWWD